MRIINRSYQILLLTASMLLCSVMNTYGQTDAREKNSRGVDFLLGEGVMRNPQEAFRLFEESAREGYILAMNNLANCYYNGEGTERDYHKAFYWYGQAAKKGNATAQCSVGECYYYGNGVSRDLSEAVRWFQASADQGYANAQYHLGLCYNKGHGVFRDTRLCIYCNCYDHGFGVDKDHEKALYWWQRAANQGYAKAQEKLGR